MIEARKYHKGLEKEIFLTRVRFSKDTPLSRIERDYYENLKPDWEQIQKDKDEEWVLNALIQEYREQFIKHWTEFFEIRPMNKKTTVLGMPYRR